MAQSSCKLQELAKDPKAGTIIPFEEPCELFQREYQRLTQDARIIAITVDIIPESDGWSQEDKIKMAEACKLRIIDVATYLLVTGNASAVLHQYVKNATYCVENYTFYGDDEDTDDCTYNATVGTWNNSILVSYNVEPTKDGVGKVWNSSGT